MPEKNKSTRDHLVQMPAIDYKENHDRYRSPFMLGLPLVSIRKSSFLVFPM